MTNSKYVVILTRNNIDRFQHHALFSRELVAAFARRNLKAIVLDYIDDSKKLFKCIQDSNCKFFVTFNGFGTELQLPSIYPGRLDPVYQVFGKPILDIMHDCPLHESMEHQLSSIYDNRRVFITDYRYAEMALDLGLKHVNYVPSITFPEAASSIEVDDASRIDILLAAGFLTPDYVVARFDRSSIKGRLYYSVFDEIGTKCSADWNADPAIELKSALFALGISFDWRNNDHRFLLTAILDYVKFERRRQLLVNLVDFPISIVPDREIDPGSLGKNFNVFEARSAKKLLELMARSSVVICPTTHMTGFHERPLSAFTVGAAVVSAPCGPLYSHFVHNEDIVFYSNGVELQTSLHGLLQDRSTLKNIADAGRNKASKFFSPDRLVGTMLNSVRDVI